MCRSRDFEKVGRSMSATVVDRQRKFYASGSLKGQKNVRSYRFSAKYLCQYFQIFSMFILPMKPYQFLNIYKRFGEEWKKALMQKSMRKKTEKSLTFFITGCFDNQLFFLFRKLIHRPIFAFWYQDNARNIKRRSWKRQIARNGKLQYLFQK